MFQEHSKYKYRLQLKELNLNIHEYKIDTESWRNDEIKFILSPELCELLPQLIYTTRVFKILMNSLFTRCIKQESKSWCSFFIKSFDKPNIKSFIEEIY